MGAPRPGPGRGPRGRPSTRAAAPPGVSHVPHAVPRGRASKWQAALGPRLGALRAWELGLGVLGRLAIAL